MDHFIMGAIAMGSATAGLFFLRFWRETGDRLFCIFAIAFWLLGLTRVALVLSATTATEHSPIYWVRLVVFGLILAAILDKSRNPRRRPPPSGNPPQH
ncbi:DUF5985 family protein [Planctomicrobium piriforme]|uniref:Uncharacterized protein n=1 Tax=Planctomicrobium piriforme TaxID=1576369 RepID=A0A1I3S0L5_9PLAN|nr:DUF5985 family protein [Planctomicrobium piriforme]SFJ51077.1 hypothetical protein SAMN05421753_12235 [Planctomicrobium piriforme]